MMSTTTLVAAPLFVLMATVLERSGVSEDLYDMMYRWMGPVRVGLTVGCILAGGVLGPLIPPSIALVLYGTIAQVSIGAMGAIICSAIHGKLNWDLLKESAYTTIKVQGFMMWILFAAQAFAAVYMGLGASRMVIGLVKEYQVGWWAMLIGIQVIWFLLGFVIDAWSILMITAPIILPLLPIYGFNPLWLGVLWLPGLFFK